MLDRVAIREFQKIYLEEFGEEIPYEEALRQGNDLLRLFEVIFRPIPQNVYEESDGHTNSGS